MAKTDLQAAARPPRPSRRVRLEARGSGGSTPSSVGESLDAELEQAESGSLESDGLESDTSDSAESDSAESDSAESDSAGLDPEGIDRGRVMQSGSQELRGGGNGAAEARFPFNFFEPRGTIRPRATVEFMDGLPVATLEGPSTARLDLTPSPVPRVSLVPATGLVDISLVPGPNSFGSRNLPTLAARYALGRSRQRAATPAVTFPPSVPPQQGVRAAPRPVKKLHSSQREVVLGLAIGIGLSILLGVVGQALLQKRGQPEAPVQAGTPGLVPPAASEVASLLPVPAVVSAGLVPAGGFEAEVPPKAAAPTPAPAARPAAHSPARSRAVARNRASRAVGSKPGGVQPAAPNPDKSPDGAELPAKTPLSPSESAGLGLDLPL